MKIDLRLISSRLAEARRLQSVELAEAAAQTGIEVARLEGIETGRQAPSGDELLILANYYARDFRDFVDPCRPEPFKQTDVLYRRYGQEFSPSDRRAVQEFIFLCEIEATLEKELGWSSTPFSFKPTGAHLKTHGEQAAQALRRQMGYGSKQIRLDVYSDFRSIGFHVFRRRLANSEISGLYINHPVAGHCLLVNYEEDIYRQRFSVAHEAAHAIFDSTEAATISYQRSSSKYSPRDLKEIRANRFASCYLMPAELLPKIRQWDTVLSKNWAQTLKVSTEALSYALLDANLVGEDGARLIRSVRVPMTEKSDPEAPVSLNGSQLDRRLRLLTRGLSDYYVGLCFEAHNRGLISAGRLGEVLLADYNEMREISLLYGRSIVNEL